MEVVGECNRQLGGEQLYARLKIKLEPSQHEGPPVLVTSRCSAGIPGGEFLMAALDELQGCSEGGGVIGGFPADKAARDDHEWRSTRREFQRCCLPHCGQ